MKKQTTKNLVDRKLTKKEKQALAPLYETYKPIQGPMSPEEKARAKREMDELFA